MVTSSSRIEHNIIVWTPKEAVICAFAIVAALMAIGVGRLALMSIKGVNLGPLNALSGMGGVAAYGLEIGGGLAGSSAIIYFIRKIYLHSLIEKKIAAGKINTRPSDIVKLKCTQDQELTTPDLLAGEIKLVLDKLNFNEEVLEKVVSKIGQMVGLLESEIQYQSGHKQAKALDKFTFWQTPSSKANESAHVFVLRVNHQKWSFKHFTALVGNEKEDCGILEADREFTAYLNKLDNEGSRLIIDEKLYQDTLDKEDLD